MEVSIENENQYVREHGAHVHANENVYSRVLVL